jgi:phosphopantetheinyl transferase
MEIYIIKTSEVNNVPETLLKNFQKKNITNKKRWLEHCFSYLMLDRILSNVYNIKNTEIEFINSKPHLINKEKCFSISHSNEYIAIAVSDFNCGIDIEKNRPRDYINIAERMGFNCNSLQSFYTDWTYFEAEYKLAEQVKSYKTYVIENYTLTAVSINNNEVFEIYIQN